MIKLGYGKEVVIIKKLLKVLIIVIVFLLISFFAFLILKKQNMIKHIVYDKGNNFIVKDDIYYVSGGYIGEYDLILNSTKQKSESLDVFDYYEYSSYMKKWGLKQKYFDITKKYVVYSKKDINKLNDIILSGVTISNHDVLLYIWDDFGSEISNVNGYTIVVPVSNYFNKANIVRCEKMSSLDLVSGLYFQTNNSLLNTILNGMLNNLSLKDTVLVSLNDNKKYYMYLKDYVIQESDIYNVYNYDKVIKYQSGNEVIQNRENAKEQILYDFLNLINYQLFLISDNNSIIWEDDNYYFIKCEEYGDTYKIRKSDYELESVLTNNNEYLFLYSLNRFDFSNLK